MIERYVLLQRVINQRNMRPDGLRIWSDGQVQRSAEDNLPPDPTDRLDKDRDLKWVDTQQLTVYQVNAVRTAIRSSGFFELAPLLLINYCLDDPGTAIWTVNVGDETARV